MTKKKTSIYNPKYAGMFGNIGQSMGHMSAEDLRTQGRNYADADPLFNPTYNEDYAVGLEGYNQRRETTSDGSEAESEGPSFLDKWNPANIDWTSTWNLGVKKLLQGRVDDAATKLRNTTADKQSLQEFSKFLDEYDQFKQELQDLEKISRSTGDPSFYDRNKKTVLDKYKDIPNKIAYYKYALKTNPVLQETFYDFGLRKNGDADVGFDNLMMNAERQWNDLVRYELPENRNTSQSEKLAGAVKDATTGARNPVEGLLSAGYRALPKPVQDQLSISAQQLGNIGSKLGNLAAGVLEDTYNSVKGIFTQNDGPVSHQRAVRKDIAAGHLDKYLSRMQMYNIGAFDTNTSKKLNASEKRKLQADISRRINSLDLKIAENKANLSEQTNKFKHGIPWLGYDPSKIKAEYEEIQARNRITDIPNRGLESLIMTIPEVGTSFSDAESFFAQLGEGYIGGKIASALAGKGHPILAGITTVATALGQLGTAMHMRHQETNIEANQAYLQRVQQESIDNKVNLYRILNIGRDYLKSQGYAVNEMKDDEILSLTLAYNVPTGDSKFEQIKRDARKGLAKLEAQNNALAYGDYLEVLPFSGYATKYAKRAVEKVCKNMVYKGNLLYTADDLLKATAKAGGFTAGNKFGLGWISHKIDKILLNSGSSMAKKIAQRNLIHSIGNNAKKAMFVSLQEGVEEGQQAFMTENYATGQYDADTSDYDFGRGLDIRSLADDFALGTQATLAYFGLDPDGSRLNGTDELRQQMEIGALTSLWFGLGHHAIGSAFNDPNSIRGWIQQYKYDKNLMRYVANEYVKHQDDVRAGVFFDAIKNGNNIDRIKKSYAAFRALKNDETVTDEDIDDDIKLAETISELYKRTKNKKDETLSLLNIERDSDEHREFVKQAASVIHDYSNVSHLASETSRGLSDAVRDLKQRIKTAPDVEKDENGLPVAENRSLESKFKDLLQRSYKKYQENNNATRETLKGQIKAIEDAWEQDEDGKHSEESEKEHAELTKKLDTLNDVSEEQYTDSILAHLIARKQIEIAKGLFSNVQFQKNKLSAIKKAFGYKINIETLSGISSYISDLIERLNKKFGKGLENENAELFAQYDELTNSEDFRNLIAKNILNNAVLDALSYKYQAYQTGRVNPKFLNRVTRRTKWKDLTDSQRDNYKKRLTQYLLRKGEDVTTLDDRYFEDAWEHDRIANNRRTTKLAKRFKEVLKKHNTDESMLPEDEAAEIDALTREAAQVIIQQDMAERFQRRQIIKLEEEQDAPLTTEDLDAANEGDEKAQKKIVDTVVDKGEKEHGAESEKKVQKEGNQDEVDSFGNAIESAKEQVLGVKPKPKKEGRISTKSIDDMIKEGQVESPTPTAKETAAESEANDPQEVPNSTEMIPADPLVEPQEPEQQDDDKAKKSAIGAVLASLQQHEEDHTQTPDVESNETDAWALIDQFLAEHPVSKDANPANVAEDYLQWLSERPPLPPLDDNKDDLNQDENDTHDGDDVSHETGSSVDTSILDSTADNVESDDDVYQGDGDIASDDETIMHAGDDPILEHTDPVYSGDPMDMSAVMVTTEGVVSVGGKEISDEILFAFDDFGYDDQQSSSQDLYSPTANGEFDILFNYNPVPGKGQEHVTMNFSVRGHSLFPDKKMATGIELGKKLATPGWFGRVTKKYYIVSLTKGGNEKDTDDYTVALIFEDPDDSSIVYNTTIRNISYKLFADKQTSQNPYITQLWNKLRKWNVNWTLYTSLYENFAKSQMALYNQKHGTNYTDLHEFESVRGNGLSQVRERVRLMCPVRKGARVLTDAEIEHYIQQLREFRNAIIDAYCDKNEDGTYTIPEERREDVVPETVIINNGSFNNIKNEVGLSVSRPINGEHAGFGLPSEIDDVSKTIEDGTVVIGVGTGPLGVTPGPMQIRPINGNEQQMDGVGRAGKLYVRVPAEKQPGSTKTSACVQLQEQKLFHNPMPRNEDEIEESFSLDGTVNDYTNPPSLAEIAFRLITGRINKKSIVLGKRGINDVVLTESQIEALSDILINHGKQTLLGFVQYDSFGNVKKGSQKQALSRSLGFYFNKQIACVEHEDGSVVFYIGDKVNGVDTLSKYSMLDLFPPQNASEEILAKAAANRRHIISLIEHNMHWNTNVDIMMNTFDDELYSMFDSYFFEKGKRKLEDGKPVTTFNPFGNNEFSFKYDDLYTPEGKRKNNNVVSWMITNGKIMTDVGTGENDMFFAPYVSAKGVKSTGKKVSSHPADLPAPSTKPAKQTRKPAKKKTAKSTEPKTGPKAAPKTPTITAKTTVPTDTTFRVVSVDRDTNTEIYLIAAETTGRTGKTLPWSKSNPEKLKAAVLKKIDELEASGVKFRKDARESINAYKNLKEFCVYVCVKNGEAFVVIEPKGKQMTVRGVYSTEKGEGELDASESRTWLQNTLGFSQDQIIVTNGVMRGIGNRRVYGVTNLACSSILDEIFGTISLSKKGGKGIEYHEAWHYVNLLLHNKARRLRIYKEYQSKHPELKNASMRDIEEALAEDFKTYMLGIQDQTLSQRIHRFFKNIKELIKAFVGKQDVVYQAYEKIRKGKYKGAQLDAASVEEFKRNYPDGVFFDIPGLSEDKITNFKHIQDYHQFYKCAKVLCNMVMEGLDLSSVSKVQNYSRSDFDAVFETLRYKIESDPDSASSGLLQDILDNKEAFYNSVATMLKSFSLDIKRKKTKFDKEHEKGKDSADVADNVWDIDHLEVSKKINVGFKTKFFFSTIPMYKVSLDENGERVYTPDTDDTFGTQLYYSFSKVWNKMMTHVYMCDNFADIDPVTGEYSNTSFVAIVKRHADSGDSFFKAVYEKIEPLIDPDDESLTPSEKLEISTGILNTVQSANNKITVIDIKAPRAYKPKPNNADMMDVGGDVDYGGESQSRPSVGHITLDITKSWSILDSSHLQSKYILAKDWSENLFTGTGLVETDFKSGVSRINPAYLSRVQSLYDNAVVACSKPTTKKKGKYYSIEQAKSTICQVLNYMAIPADGQVLQRVIDTELIKNPGIYTDESLVERQRHVLRNMLSGEGSATIGKLIAQLRMADAGVTITVQNGKKDLQDFYKGYSKETARVKGKKKNAGRGLPWVGKLTVAYAEIYPSSAEMSVTGANGAQIYPINMNNATTDFTRRLKNNTNGELDEKAEVAYSASSIIVANAQHDRASTVLDSDKLQLNTFVCVRDEKSGKSADYFGITPLEDYLSKFIMTFNKHLTFPTMADKKTWYSLSSQWLNDNLSTDIFLNTDDVTQFISDGTLDIFSGYFMDELTALKEYYSEENIQALLSDPNSLIVNYHGKIIKDDYVLPNGETGTHTHLDFSGNGGKFRYFYDVLYSGKLNLNQQLQVLYEQERLENQRRMHEGRVEEVTDGFSKIRSFLDSIYSSQYNTEIKESKIANIKEGLRRYIIDNIVTKEINRVCTDENIQLIQSSLDTNGKIKYSNRLLPKDIVDFYKKKIEDAGVTEMVTDSDAIYTAIANHAIRSAISTIEVEKIYSGDPAMYKWQYFKFDKLPSEAQAQNIVTIEAEIYNEDGKLETRPVEIKLDVLNKKDVDKIKRLGAILSPGTNLRTSYSEEEQELIGDFGTSKYTFMNVGDVKAISDYVDNVKTIFTQNEIVQTLKRSFDDKYIIEHFSDLFGLDSKSVKNVNKIYYSIYRNTEQLQDILDRVRQLEGGKQLVLEIESKIEDSISPYTNITVSDAQVCLRPAMYRKLRIAVGEWSFTEDETGYSDEKAYRIMESDPTWMENPEKYVICRKLQLKPLKMSYFSNFATKRVGAHSLTVPVYNKMAMFPMFEYVCRSKTGKLLYERMNRKGNEIDMFGFESSVKVGCNQKMYKPCEKGTNRLDVIDEKSLNKDSNASINYQTGEERYSQDSENTLAVQIQDMNNLHLQLNTDAHEDTKRDIGTQMMKICFSNVDPNMRYGKHGQKGDGRLGKDIRNDIFNVINAMTSIGEKAVRKKFFKKDKDGNYTIPDKKRIHQYFLSVCERNDLGMSSEEIMRNGGKIASLTARQVFEQSIASMVNDEVIDIKTQGGAAVQQSCFGFEGFDNRVAVDETVAQKLSLLRTNLEEVNISPSLLKKLNPAGIKTVGDILNNEEFVNTRLGKKLRSEVQDLLEIFGLTFDDAVSDEALSAYEDSLKGLGNHVLNDGKALKWYNGKGTMEVMLSLNFFRDVIPEKYFTDYKTARQWLVDNDIIKGTKSNGTESNPDPFGIGYRIPTQGMSSTFGFVVADVLPETSGDLIIVPKEFTAQTGSDFDVDKLYLATYSYEVKGDTAVKYQTSSKSDMSYNDYLNEPVESLGNKLIDNYLDIIADYKNTADARASIDVLTEKLKTNVLPFLEDVSYEYADGGYELLPSFQALRKMEYSTGKSGIGPFALNVTNLALTQAVGLRIDVGGGKAKGSRELTGCYTWKNIDDVVGMDGYQISAWLSAMVNAHVDVAKDPYILTLNVNRATYNYTNLLLRTGHGIATFTFLAQPALKRMADMIVNARGMYGQTWGDDKYDVAKRESLHTANKIRGRLKTEYVKMFEYACSKYAALKDQTEQSEENGQEYDVKKHAELYELYQIFSEAFKGGRKPTEAKVKLHNMAEFRVLDVNSAKKWLKQPQNDYYNLAKWSLFQLMCIDFIGVLEGPANALSTLVNRSPIDTKKFGNNIISQLNFVNSYNVFKYGGNNAYFSLASNDNIDYPLVTYFEKTFLDKKLKAATKLVKNICRNQTFTATPLFGKVYQSMMAQLFGDVVYNIPTKDPSKPIVKFGYTSVTGDDRIQTLGKALESVFRHRAFLAHAKTGIGIGESVDLTLGGDEAAVTNKLKSLLYSKDGNKSLPSRLSSLKAWLKQQVAERVSSNEELPDWLAQLCDVDGVIKNELLNYLIPRLDRTGKFVDRLTLASSSMDVDAQFKLELQSAFSELLSLQTSSQSEQDVRAVSQIRQLAQDLVFYSYYTTYNNGGVNQFFDIVPPAYRLQYDNAISKSLDGASNSDVELAQSVLNNDGETTDYGSVDTTEVLDAVCKNFWWDDDVVKTMVIAKTDTITNTPNNYFAIRCPSMFDQIYGLRGVNMGYAIKHMSSNRPYIKVEKGPSYNRKVFLYQKVGEQVLFEQSKDGVKQTVVKDIYFITNKLGLKGDKNKIYEFGYNSAQSMFEENMPYVTHENEDGTLHTWLPYANQEYFDRLFTIPKGDEKRIKLFGKKAVSTKFVPYRALYTIGDTLIDDADALNQEHDGPNNQDGGEIAPDKAVKPSEDGPKDTEKTPGVEKETETSKSEKPEGEPIQTEQNNDTMQQADTGIDDTMAIEAPAELYAMLGVDVSSLPQSQTEQLSEQDSKEAEEHKSNCKQE